MAGRGLMVALLATLTLPWVAHPFVAWGQEERATLTPASPAAAIEIRQLIRELDHDVFAIRERASQRLRQMDASVVPFLEEAITSRSPEVRMRAAALLKLMRVDPLEAFCALPDSQLDVEQGMFFISQILNPKVKKEELTKQLDEIAAQVREKLGKDLKPNAADPQVVVTALRKVMFDDLKFKGNKDDYDNPDNSSLERVLATRKGLPITLSRIVVLVARRLDVPIVGVPATGRYIVKYDGARAPVGFPKDDIYIHPFEDGKILSREDRLLLYPGHDPDVMVAADTNRAALTRVLRNLSTALDHDPARAGQLTRVNEMLLLLQAPPPGFR